MSVCLFCQAALLCSCNFLPPVHFLISNFVTVRYSFGLLLPAVLNTSCHCQECRWGLLLLCSCVISEVGILWSLWTFICLVKLWSISGFYGSVVLCPCYSVIDLVIHRSVVLWNCDRSRASAVLRFCAPVTLSSISCFCCPVALWTCFDLMTPLHATYERSYLPTVLYLCDLVSCETIDRSRDPAVLRSCEPASFSWPCSPVFLWP